MKQGKDVTGVESEKRGVSVESEKGDTASEKKGEMDSEKKGETTSEKKEATQPAKTEVKRQPPVDADGKPVSVDHHWKEFVKKSGKSVKRREEKKEERAKKVKTFFDDDAETVGTKKVPLRSKCSVCWERRKTVWK